MIKLTINNKAFTLDVDPDMALLDALSQNFFYVGALGSKRNNEKRRQRLAEFELSPQQISKLHAPVGLPIGSHTPAEIAVSIMADITAARNSCSRFSSNAAAATQTAQQNISAA